MRNPLALLRDYSLATLSCLAVAPISGCWRIGEPTESEALVTWAAYPETVVVNQPFSLEFAGPVSPNTCGRLDTAVVALRGGEIALSATRSVFDATCSGERVSFYHARPFAIDSAGVFRVRGSLGELGTITALDSGSFSPVIAVGDGTVRGVGDCYLFGPGWSSNQRTFALRDAPSEVRETAGTDRVVFLKGRFFGFTLCGRYGSRPTILVDSAAVTERTIDDYYRNPETP